MKTTVLIVDDEAGVRSALSGVLRDEGYVVDAVESDLGAIDVYVNNAGIMPLGRFLDEDDATAQRMIDINLHGVIWGMKAVLPRMIARNRGHVVNVSSQAGRYGTPAEFGAACAFLCSQHAGFITGQNVLMDGGAYSGTL